MNHYWRIEVMVTGRIVAECPATGEIREIERNDRTIEANLRTLGRTIDNDRKQYDER